MTNQMLYAKDFVVRFRDHEGVPLNVRELCNNIRIVEPAEYTEDNFGMGCRGKVTVQLYDTVEALQGIDLLAKQSKFTMIINITDKSGTTVAQRWLKECSIRRVVFGQLDKHNSNAITSTEFLIEFNQFSTKYPGSEGVELW